VDWHDKLDKGRGGDKGTRGWGEGETRGQGDKGTRGWGEGEMGGQSRILTFDL